MVISDSASTDPPPQNTNTTKISSTRELLQRAKEAANLKFSQSVNNPIPHPVHSTDNNNSINNSNNNNHEKRVLCSSESPAWHGELIKTTLKKKPQVSLKQQRISSLSLSHPPPPSKQIANANIPTGANSKSLFQFYKLVRSEFEDFREIEAVRLQRRLEKLSDFSTNENCSIGEYERQIVPWQSDESSQTCFVCSSPFTVLNRRHHCRLCGRVLCSSLQCLKTIPLKLAANAAIRQVKSCRKCHQILFKKQPEEDDSQRKPNKMESLYKSVKALKEQLLETIPKFNEYLLEESLTRARPLKEWRKDAWALRDTLILVSLHFRSTIQELAEVAEVEGLEMPVWRIFANNIRRAGNEFLQKHMFTLQILEIAPTLKPPTTNSTTTKPLPPSSKPSSLQLNFNLPSVLSEVFKMAHSTTESGFMEFYNEEGQIVPHSPSQLRDQQKILQEQLRQLEDKYENLEAGNSENSLEESIVLSRAIQDIQNELELIKKSIK